MGSFSRITVLRVFSRSALGKPRPSVMPRWNRLSWRDDRAVLLRSGRSGLAMQVEVRACLKPCDRLTERWVADHLRKAKASKNERELGTLELLSQATLLMLSCHAATSSLNHAILRGA